MSEKTVPIALQGQGERRSEGLAIVQHLDDSQRLRRALRSSGIALAVAIGFLPIPPVHWIVTPVGLITAVVLFVRRMGQGDVIAGGGGPCPQCQQRVELELQPLHWPVEMNCPHCRRSVVIANVV